MRRNASRSLVDPLRQALRKLARPRYSDHDARVGRIVALFRLADGRGHIPDRPVPLSHVRLDVLSYRWGIGIDGNPRPRIPLTTYRPVVELPGTGRIRFVPERARDAISRGLDGDPRMALAALAMHDASERSSDSDQQSGLILPRILFAYGRNSTPAPAIAWDHDAWMNEAHEIEGLCAWPQELIARYEGIDTDRSIQPPSAIYADLDHLRGTRVPNPAFEVLQSQGLIAPWAEYDTWSQAARPAEGSNPTAESARFAKDLEAFTCADPSHEAQLRTDLARACAEVGIDLPEGPWGESATALLLAPWMDIEQPEAPRPQTIQLSGPPSPETARFATGCVEADLGDLEPLGARYAPAEPWDVAMLLGRRIRTLAGPQQIANRRVEHARP